MKLREGVHVAAEAHQLEELLHGHLAAIDESVRCFVLEGEGRAAARAAQAAAALRVLGCDVTLVPTRHPVVDIVPFQLLTLDLAEARGVDPGPDPLGRPALEGRARRLRLRAVLEPVDEAEGLPVLVDGAALVVDEAVVEAGLLDGVEVEVGLELRGLLRPRDPEPVGRRERALERLEATRKLRAARREVDDDVLPRVGAELLRQLPHAG